VGRVAVSFFTPRSLFDSAGRENGSASRAYTSSMPLLRREADHFPDDVFRLSVGDFPWAVAHVKSRTEKALARHLTGLRIPFYLPLWERRMRRSGRSFVSYNPFFPGYVFLRGGATSHAQTLRSNVVVRLLDVPDQALLDAELCQLRALQEAGAPLIPFPWLGPGDAVRVEDGPFRGYYGVIVREKGAQRLVVSVSMLRRSVAVELERESLAPDTASGSRAGRHSSG
jgi:transcription antitermination factor NusG